METKAGAGRPRKAGADRAIRTAALAEVREMGFRAASMESIAARAGVAKTTVYRRWPTKSAVVMEAFLGEVGEPAPGAGGVEELRRLVRGMARLLRGRNGALARGLLAESLFDPELAGALREGWLAVAEARGRAAVESAVAEGELREGVDGEAAVEALFGALLYRLRTGAGPLNDAYADRLVAQVVEPFRAVGRRGSRRVV